MSKVVQIIYASTSGHTEYVCQHVQKYMQAKQKSITVLCTRVEQATVQDIQASDVLVLASSTWNTGGIEGQLNPHMHLFLGKTIAEINLQQKPVAVIGCGDERYFYTCKAADHLEDFIASHNGTHIAPTLRVINEPYHQQAVIEQWADACLEAIRTFTFPRKK